MIERRKIGRRKIESRMMCFVICIPGLKKVVG